MAQALGEPRVIKRYSNRKLYDTRSSQYVTLEQIAELIRQGEEVRVLDNSSKEDLTSVTLAQIIFEEEKRQKSFIPLGAMRHLIQSGGASLQELAQQAQARVLSVFRPPTRDATREREDGEAIDDSQATSPLPPLAESPALAATATDAAASAATGAAGSPSALDDGRRADSSHRVRELFDRSQQTLEEWQRRVDERVRHIVDSLSPFAGLEKEVAQLSLRVAALEKRLHDTSSPPHASDEPDPAA